MGARRYYQKFGTRPNAVKVHPSVEAPPELAKRFLVILDKATLRNHFLIGTVVLQKRKDGLTIVPCGGEE